MTNSDATPAKKSLAPDPANPLLGTVIGLLRQLLLGVGTLLAGHGLIGPNNTITPTRWEFIMGLILAAVPVVWSAWEKYRVAKTVEEKERIAVQATLNFVQVAGAVSGAQVSKAEAKTIIATNK